MGNSNPDSAANPPQNKLNRTFYRFLGSKVIASVSWNLFIVYFLWKVVVEFHSIFLAGSIASISLAVSLISSVPIGHLIDKLNNTRLNVAASIFMGLGFALLLLGFSLFYIYLATVLVSFGYVLKGDTFAAIIKKHVANSSITRATSHNQASVGFSSLAGYALGGLSLLFLENYAALILLSLTAVSVALAFPISEANSVSESKWEKKPGSYREVLSFFRKITGFLVFALVLNGFFVSLDVYGSGIFSLYLHSTPIFYTLFVGALPAGMIIGSFVANRYSRFLDNPIVIAMFLVLYAPILIVIGLSSSPWPDIFMAGLLGFVNPLVNVQIMSRLVKFTPKENFGKIFAFLRIFVGSSTPIMATLFSFAALFYPATSVMLTAGVLMVPVCLLGIGVVRKFYSNTEIGEEKATA